MKLKTRKRSDLQPRLSEPIVYMEVYGSNRVIYRVTAGSVIRQSVSEPFYGVTLEDLLAANPGIKNPNFIQVGDQVVIPC